MSIETTLYTTLSGDAGVAALTSTRIYPNVAPEDTALPYLIYSAISSERFHTLPGIGNMQRKVIQIDCNATTYSGAKALTDAVISALEGNGYQQSEYDLYDDTTQTHSVFIGWAFLD